MILSHKISSRSNITKKYKPIPAKIEIIPAGDMVLKKSFTFIGVEWKQ